MFSNNDFSNLVEKNLRGTKGYFDPNREKPQRGRPNHFCPAFMENLCGHHSAHIKCNVYVLRQTRSISISEIRAKTAFKLRINNDSYY
jgi:hypothetical protein